MKTQQDFITAANRGVKLPELETAWRALPFWRQLIITIQCKLADWLDND